MREELVNIRWHSNRATNSVLNNRYIKKESIKVYKLALKNPEINIIIKIKGRLRLLLKPWLFRKIIGLKGKF